MTIIEKSLKAKKRVGICNACTSYIEQADVYIRDTFTKKMNHVSCLLKKSQIEDIDLPKGYAKEFKELNRQGLTYNEVKQFLELAIKANDQQVKAMAKTLKLRMGEEQ